jgi:pyroglutamyl-peptidase
MREAGTERRPRILVTGFSAFRGAPVNSTERLIAELGNHHAELAEVGEIAMAVLDVDYRRLPTALRDLALIGQPDIAIHFGLSAGVTGFVLERYARNVVGDKPDNAGHVPDGGRICAADDVLPSALPLQALHEQLCARGLPVAWSDDAGGYLCNYLFYLSRSPTLPEFAPEMSGFIHVPPLLGREGTGSASEAPMPLDMLVDGALVIIRTCAAAWRQRQS